MKSALKNIFRSPYFILFLIIVIANWQLIFLVKGTEWDMMNFWMPWRYFMSECYNNGIVPLWNPYTQSGYPVHGDLQGPAYSPEAIVVSMLFGQNIYVLNYCFVFYLFIAAAGMYKLCYFYILKKDVSVLSGAIYALSGFNIGHGHYFYIVVSVALLPWMFYYFFRILWYGKYGDAIKLSLILFWQITTGNPSFLIIAGYLLICVFLFYSAVRIRSKEYAILFTRVKCFAALGVLIVAMALPIIYNAMEIVPLTTRKAGLDLAYAGEESFYFENFKAFLLPLFTIPPSESGQGLWSPYVGVFAILFFVAGLFLKKDFYDYALLFIGTAGLMIALGLELPVYGALHKYLPLFNVFRMPNLSVIFFLMAMLIFGAKFLADEKARTWLFSRKLFLIFSGVIFSTLLIAFFMKKNPEGIFDNYHDSRQWLYEASFARIVFVQGIIFVIAISIFFVISFLWKHKMRSLLVACLVDVGINYQLGAVSRIFSVTNAAEANAYFQRFPTKFAVPAKISLERVSSLSNGWPEYWLNTSVFLKQPDFPNSNNFELSNYVEFLQQFPKLSKNTFKNSYAFFADSLASEIDFTDSLLLTDKSTAVLSTGDFKNLQAKSFQNIENNWTCLEFIPGKYKFEVTTKESSLFVVAQNACPRWRYKVNGKEFKPLIVNHGTFPAFALPAGKWEIEGTYALPNFGLLLFCSFTIFTGLLLLIVLQSDNKSIGRITGFITAIIYLFCVVKFFAADYSESNVNAQKNLQHLSEEGKATCVNNTSFELSHCEQLNLIKNEDLAKLDSLVLVDGDELTIINSDRYFSPEAEMLLDYAFTNRKKEISGDTRLLSFSKKSNGILLDTVIRAESIIDSKNPFSVALVIDSLHASFFQEGDLFVATGEIESKSFDFPGLAFEMHFAKNANPILYKYANRSLIKEYANSKAIVIHKQTFATQVSKVIVSVWNTSPERAIVHSLRLRVIRQK